MPHLTLPLSPEEFQRLPRNGAYDYFYADGVAVLRPRVVYYRARLDLREVGGPAPAPDGLRLRHVRDADWEALPFVFARAFAEVQPFGSLESDTRLAAARSCIHQTWSGGDGPWIEAASFVAENGGLVGALLVTLVPPVSDSDAFVWQHEPPPDAVRRRAGRPHLTWVFVTPEHAEGGVATALLHAAVPPLRALGFGELVSTFIRGNDSSILWHWRNGFRLLPRRPRRERTPS